MEYKLVYDFLVPGTRVKVKAGTVGTVSDSWHLHHLRLIVPCEPEPREIMVPRHFVEPVVKSSARRYPSKAKARRKKSPSRQSRRSADRMNEIMKGNPY